MKIVIKFRVIQICLLLLGLDFLVVLVNLADLYCYLYIGLNCFHLLRRSTSVLLFFLLQLELQLFLVLIVLIFAVGDIYGIQD